MSRVIKWKRQKKNKTVKIQTTIIEIVANRKGKGTKTTNNSLNSPIRPAYRKPN